MYTRPYARMLHVLYDTQGFLLQMEIRIRLTVCQAATSTIGISFTEFQVTMKYLFVSIGGYACLFLPDAEKRELTSFHIVAK